MNFDRQITNWLVNKLMFDYNKIEIAGVVLAKCKLFFQDQIK